MKLSRLLAVNLVVLMVWAVPSFSIGTTGICAHLLSIGSGASSADDKESTLSQESAMFLSFTELGVANLGSETPALLTNLKQLVGSESPMNPFLNLRTPLGVGLSERTEPLLKDLGPDWQILRSSISKRYHFAVGEQSLRTEDAQSTRQVIVPQDVPISQEAGQKYWHYWRIEYIGETPQAYYFVLPNCQGELGFQHNVYMLSKATQEIQMIYSAQSPEDTLLSFPWMHKGYIFGFADLEHPQVELVQRRVGIFRLNPESRRVDWAEPWIGSRSVDGTHKLAHRMRASNSVVGLKFRNQSVADGEVYVLDDKQLKFKATGLLFGKALLGNISNELRHDVGYYLSAHNRFLKFGDLFMTDGREIISGKKSDDWASWSPVDAFRFSRKEQKDITSLLIFNEMSYLTYGAGKELNKELPPIVFEVHDLQIKKDLFESVDDGKSVLYLGSPKNGWPLLLSIHRTDRTATEVEVEGDRHFHTDAEGDWTFVRNQRDELMLSFQSRRDVMVWIYDPTTGKFGFKFQDRLDELDPGRNAKAFIDYESYRVVGWLIENVPEMPKLRINFQHVLSREDQSTMSKVDSR